MSWGAWGANLSPGVRHGACYSAFRADVKWSWSLFGPFLVFLLTASLQKWAERNPHEWLNFLSFHMFSLLYCWCQLIVLISEPWMPASWRILRSGLSSIALPTSLRSFWLTWRVYPALSQAFVHWKNVQPKHIRWESSFSQGPTHLCQDSPGKKKESEQKLLQWFPTLP